MLPSSSFAAFIAFHHELNTFGYAKSLQSFSGGFNDDGRISRNLDNFLGYFNIKSCDDLGASIVVQLNGKLPFTHVLINEKQAQMVGFTEGQEVILEHVHHTVCESVEIIPLSAHDFDVLDKNSSTVEEDLLQQISIVKKGMILPFWLSPSICAMFRVGRIVPETDQPVVLHNSSELHIAPVTSSSSLASPAIPSRNSSAVSIEKVDQLLGGVTGQMNLFRKEAPVDLISRCIPRNLSENVKYISSVLDCHPSIIFTLHSGPYTVCDVVRFVCASNIKEEAFSILSRIPEKNENLEDVFEAAQSILKKTKNSSLCSHAWNLDYVRFHCTGISPKHFHELSTVMVEIKDNDGEDHPTRKVRSHILSQVAIFPIVFSHEGLPYSFHIEGDLYSVRLIPSAADLSKALNSKETCFAITSNTRIEFQEVKELPEVAEDKIHTSYAGSSDLCNFEYQNSIIEESEKLIKFHFEKPHIPAKILLLGAPGSGKTSILSRIAQNLSDSGLCIFASYIDCNTWKGKQADSIEKVLKMEMKKLVARTPSILLLENLDFFQLQNEDEQRQIGIEKIFQMIRSFIIKSKLPVLVTARKRNTLHKSLITAGGIRLFNQISELLPLTQAQRCDILRELIEPDCDVSLAAKVTENFTVADLKKLSIRVRVEATIRGASFPTSEDVKKALEYSKPSGHVVQQKATERKWSLQDVGGMEKQKKLLTEVLLWPTKYSELYESCGIQLGRGVMLHGASGCGKTLLAKAFADDTHFNVISVKGPELLSKYIGSSEENVRQVFERARASAPCIILFDELDSLAPRRGSDSTGVTDRVVNQLLTELDGAEGLQGVYVIGCTSRLDLIDPALIRPGRFDHIVECGLPSQEERASILTVILKDVAHSDNVLCEELAKRTENWTGADLKALITNAKFEAARRRNKEDVKGPTLVTMEDIEAVFNDSKPKERKQQQETFRAGQRVTLA